MARRLAIAAGAGAAVGAVASMAACLVVTVGVDMYFRAATWRETRRASRESAA